MGRLAALALAVSLGVAAAGCGGSSPSGSDCASIRSLGKLKDRIDRADTQVVRVEKQVHTLQDFPKIAEVERKALPTYQAVLKEADQGEASTADADLHSGWSELVAAARVRIHGAVVVINALSSVAITSSTVGAVKRVSHQVDLQNAQWTATAHHLNSRFGSCAT